MTVEGWRGFLAADGLDDWVGVAAGGRIVEDANAPACWILADRAGNRVRVAAGPDGAPTPAGEGK